MIEEIMIFVLGFLVAGLLALLVLPLFWRRALRLSRRRVERQMPLSMAEVAADRDRLRAEFAVERCRLEQSLDALSEKCVGAMSGLGRAEAAAIAFGERLKASETALAAAQSQVRELETEVGALGKQLHDEETLLVQRSEALAALTKDHHSLGETADERRATTAALETRLSSLEMRFADALRDLAVARRAQSDGAEQSRIFAEQRDAARRQTASVEREHRELAARASTHERRLQDMSGALANAREELAGARSEGEDLRRGAALAEERAKALRASLERHVGSRRGQERDLAERLESTESQVLALKAALEEARRDNADLRLAAGPRRRPGSREARSLKGLEVVTAERGEDRPDATASRNEDSLLDRPA